MSNEKHTYKYFLPSLVIKQSNKKINIGDEIEQEFNGVKGILKVIDIMPYEGGGYLVEFEEK